MSGLNKAGLCRPGDDNDGPPKATCVALGGSLQNGVLLFISPNGVEIGKGEYLRELWGLFARKELGVRVEENGRKAAVRSFVSIRLSRSISFGGAFGAMFAFAASSLLLGIDVLPGGDDPVSTFNGKETGGGMIEFESIFGNCSWFCCFWCCSCCGGPW